MSELTESQRRLLAFVKKNLADGLATFVDKDAAAQREKIEAVVLGHLTRIAGDLQTQVPTAEAFVSEPGVVSFRIRGVTPEMYQALWEAGLVQNPPEYVLTFTVPEKTPP